MESVLEAEVIDWKKIDTDGRSSDYESKTEYTIYPGVIYHYIGPPINMLFPSAQNLRQFIVDGIYFSEDFFVKVIVGEDDIATGEIVSLKIGDLTNVSYCPKFISKKYLTQNRYFGNRFTNDSKYVSFNKNFNLKNRDSTRDINFEWLKEFLDLVNEDEIKAKSIYSSVPSKQKILEDFGMFHLNLAEEHSDDESEFFKFLSDSDMIPTEIMNMRRDWTPGKGKGKGKIGPSVYQDKPSIPNNLAQILGNSCFIIEDQNIYKVDDKKNVEKISMTSKESRDDHLESLRLLKHIISEKISYYESEKTSKQKKKTSAKVKEKEKEASTKKKSKSKKLAEASESDSD